MLASSVALAASGPRTTVCALLQALRPEFPAALGRLTGLRRLTLDVASFAPAAGGALPAALSRMTALQSLELHGDWRHTVRLRCRRYSLHRRAAPG